MNIIEVKNNLVRVSYDASSENLIISGFVVIKDAFQSFISQVIHLEANSKGNFAILKLIFTFNAEGVITKYNGAIPSLKSEMQIIQTRELLEILPVKQPVVFGELAQQEISLMLDGSIFQDKLLICCENDEDKEIFIQNFVTQLSQFSKKVLVFDLSGNLNFSLNKVQACKDFKLPLNYDLINFVYNRLEDASAETKALIQEVFLEVQNYVKSLPEGFIPFETFKNVVDAQYEELGIPELLLLKNKLLKYYEEGVFAQDESEFDFTFAQRSISIIDLSKTEGNIQKEFISFIYSLIEKTGEEFYVFFNVEDENSDKRLLKKIFTAQNIYTTIISSYTYKYLKEIKQLSRNLILFAPIQQQNDFAGYNVFLNKLNSNEFIIYGQQTQQMPLIVKQEKIFVPQEQPQTFMQQAEIKTEEDVLDEQIKKDVDGIYMQPTSEIVESEYLEAETENDFVSSYQEDDLTEDDLDMIEDLQTDTGVIEDNTEFSVEVLPDEESEVFDEETIAPDEPVYFEAEAKEEIHQFEDLEEEQQSHPSFASLMEQEAIEEQKNDEEYSIDILPVDVSSTPIVPVYSADIEPQTESDELIQGDVVMHQKYGRGTVEKMISYGAKTLCSINFDNVGRRLLDPNLAELKKV